MCIGGSNLVIDVKIICRFIDSIAGSVNTDYVNVVIASNYNVNF